MRDDKPEIGNPRWNLLQGILRYGEDQTAQVEGVADLVPRVVPDHDGSCEGRRPSADLNPEWDLDPV